MPKRAAVASAIAACAFVLISLYPTRAAAFWDGGFSFGFGIGPAYVSFNSYDRDYPYYRGAYWRHGWGYPGYRRAYWRPRYQPYWGYPGYRRAYWGYPVYRRTYRGPRSYGWGYRRAYRTYPNYYYASARPVVRSCRTVRISHRGHSHRVRRCR